MRNVRSGYDQRDPQGMLVEVLFSDESVGPAGDSGVRTEDDDCVLRMGRGGQRVQNASDLLVEVRDVAVVLGQHRAHGIGRARRG